MAGTAKTHNGNCPVAYGTDIFGDRWTLLVLRDMLLHGKSTFGEFLDSEEKIATNILADRLKRLEAAGIVEKWCDPENRRSHRYAPTDKGLALAPVVLEIILWSGRCRRLDAARKKLAKRIETDRDGLLAEIAARTEALRRTAP